MLKEGVQRTEYTENESVSWLPGLVHLQNNWVEIFFPEAFELKIFSKGENNPFSFPFVETYRFIYGHNILDRYYIIFRH